MAPLCVSRSSDEAQRLSNCNQQTMNMFEVEEQKQLLFQLCPSYTHGILQTGLVGEVKKTRKRRRKSNKGEGNGELKKRKLSDKQVHLLEMKFGEEHKLESERKDKLAMELGLDPKTVAVWFQNRRARWKTKKLEEEYSRLKNAHEKVVVEKCHLEAEVLNLQEKLSQTEEKLSMFSKQTDGVSINSSPSSLSVDSNLQQLPDEFMVDGLDNLLCVPEYDYVQDIWGWVNMYE